MRGGAEGAAVDLGKAEPGVVGGDDDVGVAGDADAADPSRAAWQVLALIAPYTSGAARALIERLGNRYLDKERR